MKAWLFLLAAATLPCAAVTQGAAAAPWADDAGEPRLVRVGGQSPDPAKVSELRFYRRCHFAAASIPKLMQVLGGSASQMERARPMLDYARQVERAATGIQEFLINAYPSLGPGYRQLADSTDAAIQSVVQGHIDNRDGRSAGVYLREILDGCKVRIQRDYPQYW